MEIEQIKVHLESANSQDRLKAIAELRYYDPEVAIPLLKSRMCDKEFIVRSFIAMGLGKKRTDESFALLLEMLRSDRDYNVRAEAANSLSLFGQAAIPHLVQAFRGNEHWLIRTSILAGLLELNCPPEILEVCVWGIAGEDPIVQELSTEALGFLAGTSEQEAALDRLLSMIDFGKWSIRQEVAKALGKFDSPRSRAALSQLKQDEDYRVVGAALDSLTHMHS